MPDVIPGWIIPTDSFLAERFYGLGWRASDPLRVGEPGEEDLFNGIVITYRINGHANSLFC